MDAIDHIILELYQEGRLTLELTDRVEKSLLGTVTKWKDAPQGIRDVVFQRWLKWFELSVLIHHQVDAKPPKAEPPPAQEPLLTEEEKALLEKGDMPALYRKISTRLNCRNATAISRVRRYKKSLVGI